MFIRSIPTRSPGMGGEPNILGTRNVAKYRQILIDGLVFTSAAEHAERQVKCKQ